MDRPEPGLVKWSANSSVDSFVHINLQHRVVQVYEPTGHARKGRFEYNKTSRHDDFPPLTTYDWSPTNTGLLAVGTNTGMVNLLRIDDDSNAFAELGLKMTRTCQAVAFNTTGLLAVGLDRVRMDQSLHVWDVNRLSTFGKTQKKDLLQDIGGITEPKHRLEPSVSISSIKFFEDSPQTLVAGIKAQGLRIHDLRDPNSILLFQTRCNNNLAIDYADQNYFASSALDQPGVMIWDRRATSRPVASPAYTKAVDEDELAWGGALRLDKVIESDSDTEGKHSLIRSLRYCRDRRGLLAVLSRTGQLRVLETDRETGPPGTAPSDGPELLSVWKSHEMDLSYREVSRRNSRIVSFDWVTLPSPAFRPRLLVLRANGSFEILEKPSSSADHLFKLIPWQSPHRGLEEGTPYLDLMQFEPAHAPDMLAFLTTDIALSEVPIFGPQNPDLESDPRVISRPNLTTLPTVELVNPLSASLPDSFYESSTVAGKLRALRNFVREQVEKSDDADAVSTQLGNLKLLKDGAEDIPLASNGYGSCREIHEALLSTLKGAQGLSREAQSVVDHAMLLRAREKYLFDAQLNRSVVSDDPWTGFAWNWIADAEHAADDAGMILSNLDLSYLGIYSIWTNYLGENPSTRLTPGSTPPDASQWERLIGAFCKKNYLPKFEGVNTKKPHHRQLCLLMCGWGDAQRHDPSAEVDSEYPVSRHTMAAARALFRGDIKQAVEILKKASVSHPELLFVSLALQLMGRGGKQPAKEQLDFDQAVASRTDPYLQAMSSLIATGNWAAVANHHSLPLADRAFVAVRNFNDDQLTAWLEEQVQRAVRDGDIEGIVLTGISNTLVDIFARYVEKFHDVQTAILILSICYPRYIDDIRCRAWRNAYRSHLQRHKFFFQRTKFEVESTKRSKRDGIPTLKPPSRQIALRCVYCDARTSLASQHAGPPPPPSTGEGRNTLLATSVNAGISCPNCGRHLPRCVVCLEVVGVPRSDRSEEREETKLAGRFPTFCLRCDHVQHLDHARQWFARHVECPVPECRCRCNFKANPELNYH